MTAGGRTRWAMMIKGMYRHDAIGYKVKNPHLLFRMSSAARKINGQGIAIKRG
jgi:hypothetical protein